MILMCWHCGYALFGKDCLWTSDGDYHTDMRAMRMTEYERENRNGTPYTQLANGSRLYRRLVL